MTLVFMVLLGMGDLFTQKHSSTVVYGDDIVDINRKPHWGTWLFHDDIWYVVTGNLRKGSVEIWKWPKDGGFELVAATTGREGILSAAAAAFDRQGMQIIVRGALSGRILALDVTAAKPEFQRIPPAGQLTGQMFVRNGVLLGGSGPPFTLIHAMGEKPDWLESFNTRLPGNTDHPTQNKVRTHTMALHDLGDRIAYGFSFHPTLYMWDGRVTSFPIRFRGYREPPQVIKPFDIDKHYKWMRQFHHLSVLTDHKGKLMALMRKGLFGHGVWFSVDGSFVWNNMKKKTKILAMSTNEMVLGTLEETEEYGVAWTLWRTSLHPSSK